MRERLRQTSLEEIPHGTLTGYTWYSCRCENCRDANRQSRDYTGRSRTPEEILAIALAQVRRQNESLEKAGRRGQPWTGPELELILTRPDLSHLDLAKMLGRTLYAVTKQRERALSEPKYAKLAGVYDA